MVEWRVQRALRAMQWLDQGNWTIVAPTAGTGLIHRRGARPALNHLSTLRDPHEPLINPNACFDNSGGDYYPATARFVGGKPLTGCGPMGLCLVSPPQVGAADLGWRSTPSPVSCMTNVPVFHHSRGRQLERLIVHLPEPERWLQSLLAELLDECRNCLNDDRGQSLVKFIKQQQGCRCS